MNRREMKSAARREFDNWAHAYDKSILQRLLFEPSYEAFTEHLAEWYAGAPRPVRMLDIGCGTGTLAARVVGSTLPIEVVGLDYSVAMCRQAQAKAEAVGAPDRLTFLAGDSEHLPFTDGRFDVITCSNSFHHYPHQQAVLHEMCRVLVPGGRLMILDGFRDNMIGWFIFDVCVALMERAVHHVSHSRMRSCFEAAGFRDIMQWKINVFCPVLLTAGRKNSSAG
jgi:ubiquinone/menaquinone biosynthesis C-methylase UbiE